MSDAKIRRMLYARKGLDRDVAKDVLRGVYEPKQPSTFFIKRMREITKDLNEKEGVDIENPYNLIRPFIREIISTNRNISITNPFFSFRIA